MDDLISIILPVYNAEKYIEKCLNSFINQTYKNIEIICINDGSKDNSYNILKELSTKDNRIKLFTHENSGPAKTRNVGLENATGNYIMFCDSDDYYELNACELMLKTIVENNVDVVMCDCNIKDYFEGGIRKKDELDYFRLKMLGYYNIGVSELIDINVILWNKIYKRSIIINNNIRFPDGFEHDDCNFVLKYLSNCNTYYGLDLKLYNYQIINSNSVMALYFLKECNDNKRLDFAYSYQDVLDYVIKNNGRKQVLFAVAEHYKNTVFNFVRYLNKEQTLNLIHLQKSFFSDINVLDSYWYIRDIKEKNINECLRMYSIKLSKLEWIFSIKNRNFHEKVITIFGHHFFLKRKNK
ncbi:glycosyltransferase family 2 protein [Brachyspira intermedia]|uniref:glycosyltransferase family 2 protein n=1 Tax=Brachyspira intermedia TaxID=84377 RepID=UPI003004DE3D